MGRTRKTCEEQYAYRRAWLAKKRLDPVWAAMDNARKATKQRGYRLKPGARDKTLARRRDRRNLTVKEAVIEKYLRDQVLARDGFCPKFIDAGCRGAPDRLVILKGHPTYFVELKRPVEGWLEPHQKRYHAELTSRGQRVWVLNTIEAVDAFLVEIGV